MKSFFKNFWNADNVSAKEWFLRGLMLGLGSGLASGMVAILSYL